MSELRLEVFVHDRQMSLAVWGRADAAARRCRQATGAKLSGKCPGPADLILVRSCLTCSVFDAFGDIITEIHVLLTGIVGSELIVVG